MKDNKYTLQVQFIENKTTTGKPLNVICKLFCNHVLYEGRDLDREYALIDAVKIFTKQKQPYVV